jgi:hypothetical protein
MTIRKFIASADLTAALILVVLWLLFFWRLLTPISGDQASITQGDFSGQFVTFGAYQYQRFSQRQIPLWNPYNNGGLPFIADPQAAVFYPPRLLTIALADISGGWSYHALELEMMFHVLFYTLTMYMLLRRLTLGQRGSVIGALTAAIIASYGGYLSGYPPLQLALLEAGIWLPLAVLGLAEATRTDRLRWFWLLLTGLALGLSWLAGHPQTSWFLTCLLLVYFAYRVYTRRYHWLVFIGGAVSFGALAFGLSAVQLLPGLEYLPLTARVDFTFEAKGNGFPLRDLIQFILPGVMSLFSPLYISIVGLALVFIAFWLHPREVIFWGIIALIALGLSLGANSLIFPLFYNLLPGLRFFRGQERAAYLVANSLAIIAGLVLAHLIHIQSTKNNPPASVRAVLGALIGLVGLTSAVAAIIFNNWLRDPTALGQSLNISVLAALSALLTLALIWQIMRNPHARIYPALLISLLVFELFTINMDAPSNYDPVPPQQQIAFTPPPLVAQALGDRDTPFRVDGFRGLHDNFGSLYGIMDMRGISPLFLDGLFRIIEPEKINPLAWELLAVRYVYSDWEQLPLASTIIATGHDRYGPINLHQLDNPRPFAHLITDTALVDSDEFALALLRDSAFNPRNTVILHDTPDLNLTAQLPEGALARVTDFQPESFTIQVEIPQNAILSLAHPYYPGWQALIDGETSPIIRAYGGLSAVALPAGAHEVRLFYDPLSYRIGALLSLFTWIIVAILGAGLIAPYVRKSYAGIHPHSGLDSQS